MSVGEYLTQNGQNLLKYKNRKSNKGKDGVIDSVEEYNVLFFLLSELEEALLVLPFSYVPDILKLFNEFIQMGSDIELLCRCLFFLLR